MALKADWPEAAQFLFNPAAASRLALRWAVLWSGLHTWRLRFLLGPLAIAACVASATFRSTATSRLRVKLGVLAGGGFERCTFGCNVRCKAMRPVQHGAQGGLAGARRSPLFKSLAASRLALR
jgi:hypothetical protein